MVPDQLKLKYRAAFKQETEWTEARASESGRVSRYFRFIKWSTDEVLPRCRNEPQFKAEVLKNFGFLYDMMDRFKDGKRCLDESKRLFESVNYGTGIAEVDFLLGDHYMSTGESRKATLHYTEAARRAGRSQELSELKANAYWGISDICRMTGDLQKALRHLSKAERIYRKNRSDKGTSNVLWTRGCVHIHLGNLDVAERCFKEIIDICNAGRLDDSEKAPALGAYGDVHRISGRLTESLRIYDEAEQLMELMDDRTQRAWVGAVKGLSFLLLGKEKEAWRVIRAAEHLARRAEDSYSLLWTLQSKGELHRLRNELDEAEQTYLELQKLARSENYRVETAHSHLGLGEVLRQKGKPARLQVSTALKSYRELWVNWGIAECKKRLKLVEQNSHEHGGVLNWP